MIISPFVEFVDQQKDERKKQKKKKKKLPQQQQETAPDKRYWASQDIRSGENERNKITGSGSGSPRCSNSSRISSTSFRV